VNNHVRMHQSNKKCEGGEDNEKVSHPKRPQAPGRALDAQKRLRGSGRKRNREPDADATLVAAAWARAIQAGPPRAS
jgi:hypothetical protein